MQEEILAANPSSTIRILAVNAAGEEEWPPVAAASGETVPILQDTAGADAWGLWSVAYRDVVILDGAGTALGAFNLTVHDLASQEEYDTLLDFLRAAAGE